MMTGRLAPEALTEIRRRDAVFEIPHTPLEMDRRLLLGHIAALESDLAREYLARGRSKLWAIAWRESAREWKHQAYSAIKRYVR